MGHRCAVPAFHFDRHEFPCTPPFESPGRGAGIDHHAGLMACCKDLQDTVAGLFTAAQIKAVFPLVDARGIDTPSRNQTAGAKSRGFGVTAARNVSPAAKQTIGDPFVAQVDGFILDARKSASLNPGFAQGPISAYPATTPADTEPARRS